MSRMTESSRPDGLPILGVLSPLGRGMLVATVLLSIVAIVLDFGLHADPTLLFVISAAAILGLAWVVGLSTERLGSLTGPQVGGILNATFGNIAELIIAFFALQAGLIEVVKASPDRIVITGTCCRSRASASSSAASAMGPSRSARRSPDRTPRSSCSRSSGCSSRPSSP